MERERGIYTAYKTRGEPRVKIQQTKSKFTENLTSVAWKDFTEHLNIVRLQVSQYVFSCNKIYVIAVLKWLCISLSVGPTRFGPMKS
jgi:hypothetical protein